MPTIPQFVISPEATHGELPGYFVEYALLMNIFQKHPVIAPAIAAVHLDKKAGYGFVDVAGFFVAYQCSKSRRGIKEFARQAHKDGLGPKLAAIGGRRRFPTASSVSRSLDCVTREQGRQFAATVLCPGVLGFSLLRHAVCGHRDAHGQLWWVFDVDAVVKCFRQRGLPRGEDLPQPRRLSAQTAAPGYPGRKRGETQLSSDRVQHSGSDLWLSQQSTAGNSTMSDAMEQAVLEIVGLCRMLNLDLGRVVLRADGAAGNSKCLAAARAAGVRFLVRWPRYEVLDWPEVRAHLQGEVWVPVLSSGSGPARHAAGLGTGQWLGGERELPEGTRMVATRFASEVSGDKSGTGRIIGPAQYELFATDLDESCFAPEDTVTLYYGRAGEENSFARGNAEVELKRVFSRHRPGQDLAAMIGMLVWNLRTELGALLATLPTQLPRQPSRAERKPQRFEDMSWVPQTSQTALAATTLENHPLPPPAPPMAAPGATPTVKADPSPAAAAPPEPLTAGGLLDAQPGAHVPTIRPSNTQPTHPDTAPAARTVVGNRLRMSDIPGLEQQVTRRPGWSFHPQLGPICPNGTVMSLHRQYTNAQHHTALQFRAPISACATCPKRAGCTASTHERFQKEIAVVVPAKLLPGEGPAPRAKTKHIRPHPETLTPPPSIPTLPRWTPPAELTPGLLLPTPPVVVPAALRRLFEQACEGGVVRVKVDGLTTKPTPQPPYLVSTPAERQRRRHTFAERNAWNALPDATRVTVEFLRAEAITRILNVVPVLQTAG